MAVIEVNRLHKVFRTKTKEPGLRGSRTGPPAADVQRTHSGEGD